MQNRQKKTHSIPEKSTFGRVIEMVGRERHTEEVEDARASENITKCSAHEHRRAFIPKLRDLLVSEKQSEKGELCSRHSVDKRWE